MSAETEFRFYHVTALPLPQALAQILTKALGGGRRVVVRTPDAATAEQLTEALWTWKADSFLPHGCEADGNPDLQPVWLTPGNENPNGADTLILAGNATAADLTGYKLCCMIFDGNDPSEVTKARESWKHLKDSGAAPTYWQQNPQGGWDNKA